MSALTAPLIAWSRAFPADAPAKHGRPAGSWPPYSKVIKPQTTP